MKVVLFCGGLGMRLRDFSESIPKPMVTVGYRPILWNIMRYYAHFGHKEFILCLGYKADMVKDYFLNYNEYLSNDFVFSAGGKQIDLISSDIQDWQITFADTGMTSNIGERLLKVKHYLKDDDTFLANYADGLSDLPLDRIIDHHYEMNGVATFLAYKSTQSFHVVRLNDDSRVNSISPIAQSGLMINCGFFVLDRKVFDYIQPGDELVERPFQRMISEGKLVGYPYNGFWTAMDTFKDKQLLDDMYSRGEKPWEVWRANS